MYTMMYRVISKPVEMSRSHYRTQEDAYAAAFSNGLQNGDFKIHGEFNSLEEAREFVKSEGMRSQVSVGRGFATSFWEVELCYIEGYEVDEDGKIDYNGEFEHEDIEPIFEVDEIYDWLATDVSLEVYASVPELRAATEGVFPDASQETIDLALVSIRALWDGIRCDEDLPPVRD